jgi:hypothetical protein
VQGDRDWIMSCRPREEYSTEADRSVGHGQDSAPISRHID